MKFTTDLTQVADLKPLDAGAYIVRIVGVRHGTSKTNNPKLTFETQVLHPEGSPPKWYFDLSLVESALFRLKQLAEACDVLHPGGFDTDDFINKVVAVTVDVRDFDGPRNQIQSFARATL